MSRVQFVSLLMRRKAAADIYGGAGHVVTSPARQEDSHAGDLLGFADSFIHRRNVNINRSS
jgi:hypothetical protein